MFENEIVLEETDQVAVIRFKEDAIHIDPVYLDGVGQKFVRRYGEWASVRTLRDVRFEKRREKTYLNTATLQPEPA